MSWNERYDHFEDAAVSAVGWALLHRESPNGGSISRDIDKSRVRDIVEEGISAEDLYELLVDVGKRAAYDAQREYEHLRSGISFDLQKLAHKTDSHSLHLYIERLKETKA
jgi:hypothetical protein